MTDSKKDDDLRHLGVLLESLQDDVQRILELVSEQQKSISKIPKMSERIEELEYNISTIKLATAGTNGDLRLIKIRTEKLDNLIKQVKRQDKRIASLESA